MTKRMLIDATHAEETRVVVLDGNRLEDFDVETSTKRQLKGNIYLAKVVRVEPSLQACFVDYGGNRHGFLAFSEIHPDYYQIPVADRQRLLELEAEEAQREEEEADRAAGLAQSQPTREARDDRSRVTETSDESGVTGEVLAETAVTEPPGPEPVTPADPTTVAESTDESGATAEVLTETAATPETDASSPAPSAPAEPAAAPASAVPTEAATTEPESAAAVPAEPAEAVTSDESGATADMAAASSEAAPAEPAAPASAEAPEQAASVAADNPEDDEDTDRQSNRAQPLIIEQDTLSGPVETEEPQGDSAAAADTESWAPEAQPHAELRHGDEADFADEDAVPETPPPETVGGEPDNGDEHRERRIPPRFLRNYKIQEVIRRRQILLVQVVKEERGTKGAALTTYLSLAGRFSVLMPNSPRGGGISRKITSATDRRRLKEIIAELDMPKGMGLIVRTAGANRPKPEIRRDCEYLLRLWDDIREHTLKSVAPALIYEEASLIKRAIRDVYSRDIDEIIVDGEDGWRQAHEFMRMLMPSHAKKVQLWRDQSQPLFARYQVEAQLDAMLQPTVQLRSGGYLVINQAEALVAIDVNSGRSTRERNVEETALRTNLEAADEVARQLRLRDLAGLIVIDFIDMESKKHNAMVERRIKEALKSDRARIQVGHISHFGLLEMSRQRLRPSLAETSFILCPHCGGTGHVRSTESAAIHVLRGIEDEGSKRRSAEIVVHVATPTALYILNHKRDRLREIETRYGMRVTVLGDDTQVASQYRIDRVRAQVARDTLPPAVTPDLPPPPAPEVIEAEVEEEDETTADEETEAEETAEGEGETAGEAEAADEKGEQGERRRRRRRRRRPGRREEGAAAPAEPPVVTDQPAAETAEAAVRTAPEEPVADEDAAAQHIEGVPEHAEPTADEDGRRRRGRRGGRRRRREGDEVSPFATPGAEQPDLPPVYIGPTPANPFGGQAFDIFDVLEQAEANAAAARTGPAQPVVQQFEPEPAAGHSFVPSAEESEARQEPEAQRGEGAASEVPAASEAASEVPAPGEAAAAEIVNAAGPEPSADTAVEPGATNTDAAETATPAQPAAVEEPTPEAKATTQPAASDVANDVVPEPAVRPIIVGGDEAVTEKKRGWWRR